MVDNRLLYQETFLKKLEQFGIVYKVTKQGVCFQWSKQMPWPLNYTVCFWENRVNVCAWGMGKVSAEQLGAGYKMCSEFNCAVNWAKLFLDKHNELLCMIDTVLNPDDAVEEIRELLVRMDAALAEKQALWQSVT